MKPSAAHSSSLPAASQTLPKPLPPTPEQMWAQLDHSAGNLGLQSGVVPQVLPECWTGRGNIAGSPRHRNFN